MSIIFCRRSRLLPSGSMGVNLREVKYSAAWGEVMQYHLNKHGISGIEGTVIPGNPVFTENMKTVKRRKTSMAKAKRGDKFGCAECGLVVVVDEACGCATADIVCCGEPMVKGDIKTSAARKAPVKKAAKKKISAKKPAVKKSPAKARRKKK